MIKYIRGTYAMTFESGIVVETASGIGFAVHVPAGSPLYRSREGEEVMVYTLMIVKEDDISLYGFHNKESLELFRMLITVNGVGAKAAMSMMGSMSCTTTPPSLSTPQSPCPSPALTASAVLTRRTDPE